MRMTKLRALIILFVVLVVLPAFLLALFVIYLKLQGNTYYLSIKNLTNHSIYIKEVLADDRSVGLKEFTVGPTEIYLNYFHGVFKSKKVETMTFKIIDENKNAASLSCSLKVPYEGIKNCLLMFYYRGVSEDAKCSCDNLDEAD
ncbi:hypothetical protein D1605_008070 [Xylella fastidiosa subsp. fastidiosa]|uniref:Uncharacterized protein n=2 Tax=Xylella fastidiosa TaxID=2371 RepID=Q87BE7_XYLFT|nr:hypothetical protein [Xylella fastidiosa]AAO29352.1 conserved hypothetical protein [Xylella fastidiosa Temecula1]EGO82144.1 hypothetical protein XFEB_00886 [Xylella fastidiosa EB92.1]KGM20223.1 hypothetical protein JT24_08350 [Xylella fastidiosa]MBE0262257.1 hypothetical protein [Xylella fastidiosa subsp. fastidiosa]MBE0264389.1 hypothetical protein [Xylella fastidiosa subsp. fastidiosa]